MYFLEKIVTIQNQVMKMEIIKGSYVHCDIFLKLLHISCDSSQQYCRLQLPQEIQRMQLQEKKASRW